MRDANLLPTMTLLATLRAAGEVEHARRERAAGRDPSAQEEADIARPLLARAADELAEHLVRLRTLLAYDAWQDEHEGTSPFRTVRRFDALLTIARAERLLTEAHQRLLSLYPAADAGLIEQVRHRRAEAARLADADVAALPDACERFVERTLPVAERLREAVQ